jgi:hypothetical protein
MSRGIVVNGRGFDVVDRGVAPSTTPDSVVYQVTAKDLSLNDGDTVSSWDPSVGSNSLSATGSPTYRASSINGNPAVEYDGSDDLHRSAFSFGDLSPPYTFISVSDLADGSSSANEPAGDNNDVRPYYFNDSGGDNDYQFSNGGATVDGGTSQDTPEIISVHFAGNNNQSEMRVSRGTHTITATFDGGALSGLTVGARGDGFGNFNGTIGFVEVHDGLPSNGLQTREDEIANEWGL